MAHDRAGQLIERLLDKRDAAYVPPLFDAAVAERVLGPSGRPLTPHRRLLEQHNGGYFHDHALHLFGAAEGPTWHALGAWNAPSGWRAGYPEAAEGLVFFAEDAFGDQFAYRGEGGEVVCFEAELARVQPVAPSFTDWLEEMVERAEAVLPIDALRSPLLAGKQPGPGQQLVAWPPLFAVESREGVELGVVDALEAMHYRASLAARVKDLPSGARIRLVVE